MSATSRRLVLAIATVAAAAGVATSSTPAQAFIAADRWATTASGPTLFRGEPITLTWSLVPDGSQVPREQSTRLVEFFDEWFSSGPAGGDFTQRPWFSLIDSAFARWSAVGGVTFVYEPHDDGAPFSLAEGVLGMRGDIRLAAASIDGPGNTLASSQFPDTGDILLDASESNLFSNPHGNYVRLRNTLMHEIGHVLGLDHVVSNDGSFLMEPSLDTSFDGPQLDDIRGLHALYGDRLECSSRGTSNGHPAPAPLGQLPYGVLVSLGADASSDTVVAPFDMDFLSISGLGDVDFFSFEIPSPARLDVDLLPRGGRFRQAAVGGSEVWIEADAISDLALAVLTDDGEQIALVDQQPRGAGEKITGLLLPAAGQYQIRVSGSREAVQLYELSIRTRSAQAPEPSSSALMLVIVGIASLTRRLAFV